MSSYIYIMSDNEEGEYSLPQQAGVDKEASKKGKSKKRNKNKQIKKMNKEASTPTKSTQFISSTYRKEKCEFYNKGSCNKGDLCTFSHDFVPDTTKKICRYFLGGSCSKGTECQYSHNTKIYPCKYFHIQNRCQNNNCRFSHTPIPADFYQEYMKDNKDHILKLYKQEKLLNKELIQFIINDLPKREIEPPPIISIPNKETPTKMDTLSKLKKDPRQRIVKKQQQPIAQPPSTLGVVKEQQFVKEMMEYNEKDMFIACLKKYFYSYY